MKIVALYKERLEGLDAKEKESPWIENAKEIAKQYPTLKEITDPTNMDETQIQLVLKEAQIQFNKKGKSKKDLWSEIYGSKNCILGNKGCEEGTLGVLLIMAVQKYLNKKVDGYYGNGTIAAIREFQKNYNNGKKSIDKDGLAGLDTITAMLETPQKQPKPAPASKPAEKATPATKPAEKPAPKTKPATNPAPKTANSIKSPEKLSKSIDYKLHNEPGTYTGTLENGKPDGKGTWFAKDGYTKYVGNWKDGLENGQGTCTYVYGEYVGNWKDGLENGRGTCTYTNGSGITYVGNWKDGLENGRGTETNTELRTKYVGNWENNWRNGQGTCTYADGREYVGNWENGLRNGQGTCTYADGSKYIGNWKDNDFGGQGTYIKKSGNEYYGFYADGKDRKRQGGKLCYKDIQRELTTHDLDAYDRNTDTKKPKAPIFKCNAQGTQIVDKTDSFFNSIKGIFGK